MTELDILRAAVTDPLARLAYADWLDEQGRSDEARTVREQTGFVRRVTLSRARDRRHPDPSKNYGIHSVDLRMALIGPCGAMEFHLFTGWHLPHVEAELIARLPESGGAWAALQASACMVRYHARQPQHDGQEVAQDPCDYLHAPCYCDGSALAADEVWNILRREGDEGVWRYLRAVYRDQFGE